VFLKLFDHLYGIVFVFLVQLTRIICRKKTVQFKCMLKIGLKYQAGFIVAAFVLAGILKIIKKT